GALARIIRCGLDVHLDVVGDDTLDGAVQALARALGVDGHVTFHGFRPTDALAAFYARAHVHVVSSRHEAASVVVLEAASTGLATVGTAAGYVADWTPDRAVAVPVGVPRPPATGFCGRFHVRPRRQRIAPPPRPGTTGQHPTGTARQFGR